MGLSNPGKVHARSSRSGNIPLTRRHALPCRVGHGTIQSKLYISHPLPHSSQFRTKKYLQCNEMRAQNLPGFLSYRNEDRPKDADIFQVLKCFYPWDYLKLEVCTTPPTSTENGKSRITDGIGIINGAVSQRIIRNSDSDYSNISTE